VRPKPSIHKFYALFHCIQIASLPHSDLDARSNDRDYNQIATSSGSASEFFIEPMLSCINDYDVMFHRNDQLAIPAGHQVPRRLPAEFHHRVKVFQLIDSKFPGYVTAESTYELVKCNDDDYYECFPTESLYITTILRGTGSIRHGPAAKKLNASPVERIYKFDNRDSSWLSIDSVCCFRCLVWPPQAADWSTRRRTHGWPDLKTVECIVNNGCDVVQISHPFCRKDEWMIKQQWRLSFSRAETVLLNSWSVEQQIVYHLLRIFIKSAQRKAGTRMIIHNYIIKTIMMWTCELWSPMKWNSRNLVHISRLLLNKLATGLQSFKCSSFFIKHLNILESLESTDNLNQFAGNLKNITDKFLCVWLIDNYIYQCAEQCPPHISRLFHDNRSVRVLSYELSCITEWWRSRSDEISYTDLKTIFLHIQVAVSWLFSSADTMKNGCKYVADHLNATDSRLMPIYYAVCFLKVSSWLDCGQSASKIASVLIMLIQSGACVFSNDDSKLIEQMNDGDVPVESSGTHSFTACKHFRTAWALMLTTRNSYKKVSTLSKLLIELSKVCLHSALQCSDVECGDFHLTSRCVLNVLLSCLYCSTAQRKAAFIHSCNAISISSMQKHRLGFCHVERQLLPCFDVALDTMLGLVLFYRFVRQIFSNHLQRNRHDVLFTADLLAFYLINLQSDVYCSNYYCKSRRNMYNKYRTRLLRTTELTTADFLLFHEIYRKTIFKGERESSEICDRHKIHVLRGQSVKFNAARLGKLLVQSAVKHLTAFRVSMSRDFSSAIHMVTNDFEAMYAYKCHLYEESFRLCEENVDWLLHAGGKLVNVFVVKESDLLHLADDECLSLISLAKLCGTFDIYPMWAEQVTQLTLLMYLSVQSKLKLLHSTATNIKALRKVMIVHKRLDRGMIVSRAMMTFVYRKAVRHLHL
jgi:hypothetical protein